MSLRCKWSVTQAVERRKPLFTALRGVAGRMASCGLIPFRHRDGALTAGLGFATFQTARLLREWRPPGNPLLYLPKSCCACPVWSLSCAGSSQRRFAEALGWRAEAPWRDMAVGSGVDWRWRRSLRYYALGDGAHEATLLFADDRRVDCAALQPEMVLVALALIPAVLLEDYSSARSGLEAWAGAACTLACGGRQLVFGLMHSPQGAWGMAGAALAGLLFADSSCGREIC